MRNKETLILGLGNDILKDDGIGPRIVHDLIQKIQYANVKLDTACCGGLEIMEYIKGYNKVIFIDAIRTFEGKPGDVYYFTPSEFLETSHLSNLHDVFFLTALKLGKALDMDLTDDLHIIAIEIKEDKEFSEEFTPELKARYPDLLEEIIIIIKRLIGQ